MAIRTNVATPGGGAPPPMTREIEPGERTDHGEALLVALVQDLSLARDLATIMEIVRTGARRLTGADGATFVLRDGAFCRYAEEDAIHPLWKGRLFPMSACVSGWVMLHGEGVAIEDIYADPRIPADAYRSTFVKSLAMAPIRARAPIGAIGAYWASPHLPTPEERSLLQALADSTSVAMENVEVYAELERRVRDRTAALEGAQRELRTQHEALAALQRQKDALSALVAHDLKSPASALLLSAMLELRAPGLSAVDRRRWRCVLSSAEQINRTAQNLLDIAGSQDGKLVAKPAPIDLAALFAEIHELFALRAESGGQSIEERCDVPLGALRADPDLIRRVLQNLVDNALRHSPPQGAVRIEAHAGADGVEVCVCDEGPGVPASMRERVFDPYFRVGDGAGQTGEHQGLGLTFCRLALAAHGGTIRVEDNAPRGSRFCFRIPSSAP